MSYHETNFGLRVRLDPAQAAQTILESLQAEGVNIQASAKRLGVAERSLHRYIEKLGLAKKVEALRARARREGWLKHDGWKRVDELT